MIFGNFATNGRVSDAYDENSLRSYFVSRRLRRTELHYQYGSRRRESVDRERGWRTGHLSLSNAAGIDLGFSGEHVHRGRKRDSQGLDHRNHHHDRRRRIMLRAGRWSTGDQRESLRTFRNRLVVQIRRPNSILLRLSLSGTRTHRNVSYARSARISMPPLR